MKANKALEKIQFRQEDLASLWSRFTEAGSQTEYFHAWLALQCSRIPGALQGILVMKDSDTEKFTPVSWWPERGCDVERLAEIAERVIDEGCGLLQELPPPSGDSQAGRAPHYGLAYPVFLRDLLHGVVAVEMATDDPERLKTAMDKLQWGASWLELLFCRTRMEKDEVSLKRLRSAMDLLAAVLSEERFEGAATALVTELATRLDCDRVSLGYARRNRIRLKTMSHSAQFGKRMNLVRSIEKAMDEAGLQGRQIRFPAPKGHPVLVSRDHQELSRQFGSGAILSVPLHTGSSYQGAMTLERPGDRPFSDEDAAFCDTLAAVVAPVLEEKRLNDRWLVTKVFASLWGQAVKLLGRGYPGGKLFVLLATGVVIFFSLATGEYRITADAILEGAVKRVVVSPFEGYIKTAPVRAGDVVKKGALMCTLDDQDLRLERLKWLTQRTQLRRQLKEALAKHDWGAVNILKAQLEQGKAQLDLVESRLKRTRVSAPFDGIVLRGDLSQMLGGHVAQGEVLFEVAPLNAYRLILQVDERRVADVRKGQQGDLVLSSLPGKQFKFIVEKITPISTAREGRNYFRVEARILNVSQRLRPGMEGVGKVFVERRKLVRIWTQNLREWFSLWLWSWWP